MHIDFPVLLTTVLGFLIVVWILRRFAWNPILDLLDARRDKIRADFAEAEGARSDAEKLKGDFEVKISEIKVLERERIQEAAKQGEELAGRIREEAQGKAEASLAKARTDLLPYPQRAIRTKEFLYIHNFKPARWPMGTAAGYGAPAGPLPEYNQLVNNTFGAFGDLDASPTKAYIIEHRSESGMPRFFDFAFTMIST